MKYLKIQNTGKLDIRLIALMGGTTKSDDEYKIGHFGTGLKYTLAYLFRNKVQFKIFVGEDEVEINTEREEIGEQVFDIIKINNHRTSITTQMGNDWKAWMIVRELYSNALDEGGASYSLTEEAIGHKDATTFYIEMTPEIIEVYNSWDKYFVVGKEPFYETERYKIYPATGNLVLYKQGILIHESKQKSLFNYDIKNADINELREYKGHLETDIAYILFGMNKKKCIQYFIENVTEDHYEATIDYDYWSTSFSDEWKKTLEGVKIIHKKAKEQIEARGLEVDIAANIVVPEKLYKGLSKQFEGVGALRVSKEVNNFYEIYNERLHDKVKKSQSLLEEAGYFIEPELTYIYGIFGDKKVLAKIDVDKKKIYISEKHLDTDLFSICTMLVEENEHYKTGHQDHTREFQQHFINLYVNSIIEKEKVDAI